MKQLQALEVMEREGQVGTGVLTGIIVTVASIITLFIAFLVVSKVRGALPFLELTAEENATLEDLDANTQDIFSMMGITILVGVVLTLLGAVIGIIYLLR